MTSPRVVRELSRISTSNVMHLANLSQVLMPLKCYRDIGFTMNTEHKQAAQYGVTYVDVNLTNVYEVFAPSVPFRRSVKSSWNSSLRIASRLCFSSSCSFNIPRFSSALITWFSLRMRTAFMRRWREPLMTYPTASNLPISFEVRPISPRRGMRTSVPSCKKAAMALPSPRSRAPP